MIKIITTEGNEVFVGEDYKAVVRRMRETCWFKDSGKREYMEGVRNRVKILYDIELSFPAGDYKAFLEALEQANLVEIREAKNEHENCKRKGKFGLAEGNQEIIEKPAHYWLQSLSPESFEVDKTIGFKVAGFKKRYRATLKKFKPNDRVLYYITKIGKIGALIRVISECYEDDTKIWPEEKEMWPLRVKCEPEIILDKESMLDVPTIKGNLSFVKKFGNYWWLAFQGGIREIPEEDFKYIKSEMKKRKKPASAPTPPISDEENYEKKILELPLKSKSLHDRLGEMLEIVGSRMDYNSTVRQKITPEHVYELDVAWLQRKNPHVAIEVQIGGNIVEALARLKEAKKFNYRKLILVIKKEQLNHLRKLLKMDELRHWLDVWSIKSVYELYNSGERFFALYERIEDSRYKEDIEFI